MPRVAFNNMGILLLSLLTLHSVFSEEMDDCQANPNLCQNGICRVDSAGSYHSCECPTGFQFNTDLLICEDVDECAINDRLCENGKCLNVPGSYACDCDMGFLPTNRKRECIDIDECASFDDLCTNGECMNLLGTFRCMCDVGYNFGYKSDLNCTDIDECQTIPDLCRNGICINSVGSYRCDCPTGFQFSSDSLICEDIDECQTNPNLCRNGICINSVGSYRCECPTGFQFSSDSLICEDIDECQTNPNLCRNGICINSVGSYRCECPTGFQFSSDSLICEDIDECQTNPNLCRNGICINSVGSYRCECPIGFQFSSDSLICEEMDDCQANPNLCQHGICRVDSAGSYHSCECPTGFQFRADLIICEDIDECAEQPEVCGRGQCTNALGSYNCVCENGFRLSEDRGTCVDDPFIRQLSSNSFWPRGVPRSSNLWQRFLDRFRQKQPSTTTLQPTTTDQLATTTTQSTTPKPLPQRDAAASLSRRRGAPSIRRPGFSWPRGVPQSSNLWQRFLNRFRPNKPSTTTLQPTTTAQPVTTTQPATTTTAPPPLLPVMDSAAFQLCDTKEFNNSLSCRLERDYPDVQRDLLTRFGERLFMEPEGEDGRGSKSCKGRKRPVLHDKKGKELDFGLGFPELECGLQPRITEPASGNKPGIEVPGQPDQKPDRPEEAFNPCGYSASMVSPIHALTVGGETVELWAGTRGGQIKQQTFREVKCTSATPNHQGCGGRCVEESTWHRAIVVKAGARAGDPPQVGWDMIVVKASCSCHVVTGGESSFFSRMSVDEAEEVEEVELDSAESQQETDAEPLSAETEEKL